MIFEVVQALTLIIPKAATVYTWLIIASALMSWVRPDPYNPIVRFIRGATEPAVDAVRRTMPFLRAGMIDFSPLVLMLLIQLVSTLLVTLLNRVAEQM